MKKKITKGISFPNEEVLAKAKERFEKLGLGSFSEYVNQLIKRDVGLPNIFDSIESQTTPSLLDKKIEAEAFAEKERMLAEVRAAKKASKSKSAQ